MSPTRHLLLFGLPVVFAVALVHDAAAQMPPPIVEIKVRPKANAFKDAKRNKPLVLRTKADATKYFEQKALDKVMKQADLSKQFLVVFAWRGSGQDKLTFAVAESFPEQIFFSIKPGLTRDLRPHTRVFALRSNVRWSVRKRR